MIGNRVIIDMTKELIKLLNSKKNLLLLKKKSN